MKKLLITLVVILLVVIGSYFLSPLILDRMAQYLVVSDKLEKADVILVLAGDSNGERVDAGVKLYKQGYAKYILMSGGPMAWHLTYADWMKKQAVQEGVPAGVVLLQNKSRSTIDDARFSLPIMQKRNFKSVILVTSPYHTRRAAGVFRKMLGPAGIRVMVIPTDKSDFNPDRWWTRHEDTAYVVWEYVSLVLYFLKGYN